MRAVVKQTACDVFSSVAASPFVPILIPWLILLTRIAFRRAHYDVKAYMRAARLAVSAALMISYGTSVQGTTQNSAGVWVCQVQTR